MYFGCCTLEKLGKAPKLISGVDVFCWDFFSAGETGTNEHGNTLPNPWENKGLLSRLDVWVDDNGSPISQYLWHTLLH